MRSGSSQETQKTAAMDSRHNSESVESGRSVLEARGLKKTYGTREKNLEVLVDANLELHEGEMVAVVAPSGAGKSTLLHLLAALDTPTSGTVYFENKAIETQEDAALAEYRNRAVGFLWQRHQLLPDFTATENVAMPLPEKPHGAIAVFRERRVFLRINRFVCKVYCTARWSV